MPNEHTQTSTRTRLLWTLGLTAAGIGLTLALDSPAHADEPATPILGSVEQILDNAVRNVTELPAAALTPGDQGKPRPVRNLVTHTTKTVDTAVADVTSTVRAVTDTVDKTTRPLPVLGGTVDQVTDLTDTITGSLPTLTPLATVDAAPTPNRPAQPAPGDGSDDTGRGGTTPNPAHTSGDGSSGGGEGEDAPGAAPVPHGQAAGPGAQHPTISSAIDAKQKTSHADTHENRARVEADITPAGPERPGAPDTTLADHTANTDGQPRQTIDGDNPANWPHCPTHHHYPDFHQTGLGGRTLPPPAPSG